jgi:hypothetical protein
MVIAFSSGTRHRWCLVHDNRRQSTTFPTTWQWFRCWWTCRDLCQRTPYPETGRFRCLVHGRNFAMAPSIFMQLFVWGYLGLCWTQPLLKTRLQVSEFGMYTLASSWSWTFACVKIWFGLSYLFKLNKKSLIIVLWRLLQQSVESKSSALKVSCTQQKMFCASWVLNKRV